MSPKGNFPCAAAARKRATRGWAVVQWPAMAGVITTSTSSPVGRNALASAELAVSPLKRRLEIGVSPLVSSVLTAKNVRFFHGVS